MSRVTARRAVLAGTILFVVLGAAALWLPGFIRDRINASLAIMPGGYRGHAESVSIHPVSLALHLEGFRIEKRDGSPELPYMRMQALVAEVVPAPGLWPELELRFVKPQVNFVDAESNSKQMWGPHIDLAQLKKQLTLQLRRVIVEDGEVHLRHFGAEPPVDVYATHVNVLFDELTDCLPPSTACHATLTVRGRPMAGSALSAHGALVHDESESPSWRFDLRALVDDLELRRVNSALIHYAKLDVQRGKASLRLALHQHDEHLYGSLRPLLSGVDVVGKRDAHTRLGPELAAGLAAHFVEKRKGKVVLHFDKRGTGALTGRLEVQDEAPGELASQARLAP